MMKINYIKPICEIVAIQSHLFCADDISGTEEKQGYIVVDPIRDEMVD